MGREIGLQDTERESSSQGNLQAFSHTASHIYIQLPPTQTPLQPPPAIHSKSTLLTHTFKDTHAHSDHPEASNLQSSWRPQLPAQFQPCCDRTQEACVALGGSIKSNSIFFYFRRRFRSGQRCFTQTFKTGPLEEGISKNKSLHSSGPHRETKCYCTGSLFT